MRFRHLALVAAQARFEPVRPALVATLDDAALGKVGTADFVVDAKLARHWQTFSAIASPLISMLHGT